MSILCSPVGLDLKLLKSAPEISQKLLPKQQNGVPEPKTQGTLSGAAPMALDPALQGYTVKGLCSKWVTPSRKDDMMLVQGHRY